MKKVIPPHIKTITYILPVGKGEKAPHKEECNCDGTKGKDHSECRYKVMPEMQ